MKPRTIPAGESQSEQNRNRRPSAYAGNVRDSVTGRFVSKAEAA
ncbi:hypothetical protein AB0420_02185 [Streptomyces caelestis]